MRNEADITRALNLYADMVRRICFIRLCSRSDVEDVFQEVFLKYALHALPFNDDAHEKAWFVRVAINACNDINRSFWRRNVFSFEEVPDISVSEEHAEVLDAVLRLTPSKYRDVIYLHYYEGYKAVEIAAMLGKKENTIYTWLDRARRQLKPMLGGESDGE